ncbi:MAG: hypothetical protein FWC40_01840 [Proteobacteria bacterium]|nr:hypothetical protein [Pseudomonadota bacterium]
MFSRAKRSLFCVAALLLAGVAPAYGQDMEDFKARMARAASMTQENMSEALRQYLEIRAKYAGKEVDYSLGRTYQRLFQCEEAQYYYEQVMIKYDLPDDDPIYQRAVKDFDQIAHCRDWQKVYLDCAIPAGGHVLIGSERVNQCWERPFALSDGEHTFKLVSETGREKVVTFAAKSGAADARIALAFDVEQVVVEQVIATEQHFVLQERFHPALYWGLITGGVLIMGGGGGGFAALSNRALVDVERNEVKYEVLLATEPDRANAAKQRANEARDRVKLHNTLMYTSFGVGGALVVTGVTLAVISAVSPRVRVEKTNVEAFVAPSAGGLMMGFGMSF